MKIRIITPKYLYFYNHQIMNELRFLNIYKKNTVGTLFLKVLHRNAYLKGIKL